jgi:putative NADH-flavin reductase
MRVLLLGATGRIGGLSLDAALAGGHDVVALVRQPDRITPDDRLTLVAGEVRDASALSRAADGVQAVIAAIGPRANTPDEETAIEMGMRAVVATCREHEIARVVTLSGAGVTVPGDEKTVFDRVMSKLVRRFAKHVLGAKQREYEVLAASGLDWTALRPPLVTDGSAVGYRLDLRLSPGARVRRADVAQALVDQLEDRTYLGKAPFVLPPR